MKGKNENPASVITTGNEDFQTALICAIRYALAHNNTPESEEIADFTANTIKALSMRTLSAAVKDITDSEQFYGFHTTNARTKWMSLLASMREEEFSRTGGRPASLLLNVNIPGEEEDINISASNYQGVLICAIKYSLGRRTYMPSLVVGFIRPQVPYLSKETLQAMEEYIRNGDVAPGYGDEIDRPLWVAFLNYLQSELAQRNLCGDDASSKKEN